MSTIRKNYRLRKQTLARIAWLSEFLPLDNETRVIERAIDDLYEAVHQKLNASLVPHGDHYSFVVSGMTLMDIPTSALSKLGGYLAELLSPEGASYKTFGVVLLAAAAAGEGLVVYEDPIRKILGPD
jgi:hypothetical protein